MNDGLETNRIHAGDSLEELDKMDAESVHAIVTDPPYGLAFMGRDWDDFEPKEYQEWCEEWARKALRVLKPGGHMLAFSGNRTHHRLFTGVEDAGFEIRDTITWHYGNGFPKGADMGKMIDKREGAEREVVGNYEHPEGGKRESQPGNGIPAEGHEKLDEWHTPIEAPATDEAKQWDGWKTQLKPATEYVVVARKPFDGATVDCVLEHGTGALNIDGCRVDHDVEEKHTSRGGDHRGEDGTIRLDKRKQTLETPDPSGRYPANVVFDETAAADLDEQVGELDAPTSNSRKNDTGMFDPGTHEKEGGYNDPGGPSRYFYTSKATRSERTLDGRISNAHPTVKPADLMEWLVKLVTKEGQTVLDPFAGTGTTCRAAKDLGRKFVGIERDLTWADVARARCGLTVTDPSVLTADEQQSLAGFAEGNTT